MLPMERRKHNWTQTLAIVIPVLLTMIGLALASEHRITIVEAGLAEQQKQTAILAANQKLVMETLAKTTAIMDMICKRHESEDIRRSR
jgi:hypothetical protein